MCICICIRSFELWKSWKEWVLKPEHKWALNSRYWGNEWCCMRWPCCPTDKTAHYSPHSFAVAGPTTWNSLPASLHDKQLSVTSFRCLLETHLFRRAYVGTPWACSWLFPVRAGEHKLLDLDLDLVARRSRMRPVNQIAHFNRNKSISVFPKQLIWSMS